jgi:phosphopantothenoylcysteine synthetase/decarboxylase
MVGPGEGWLACRTVGMGRMAEPEEIVAAAGALLRKRLNAKTPKRQNDAIPKSEIRNPKS